MYIKGQLKSLLTDRYLLPIRNQIKDLIDEQSEVIEFGCGNGHLLQILSEKIRFGIGIDRSECLVEYAIQSSKANTIDNIYFQVFDLNNPLRAHATFDYAIASLILHTLSKEVARNLLSHMIAIADVVILVDFENPGCLWQKLLLNTDQLFTTHYSKFIEYIRSGGVELLCRNLMPENARIIKYSTFDASVKIYEIHVQKSSKREKKINSFDAIY